MRCETGEQLGVKQGGSCLFINVFVCLFAVRTACTAVIACSAKCLS